MKFLFQFNNYLQKKNYLQTEIVNFLVLFLNEEMFKLLFKSKTVSNHHNFFRYSESRLIQWLTLSVIDYDHISMLTFNKDYLIMICE